MKIVKKSFPIRGMHCASCVGVTERALKKTQGVTDAVVNLATEKATVSFDPERCTPSQLAKSINETGYILEIEQKTEDAQSVEKKKELFGLKIKVPVHAEEFGKAVQLRNTINPNTLIVANGDIMTREQGLQIVSEYGVDGVMIARGLLHNPWVFNREKQFEDISVSEKLELLKKHVVLFETTWGKTKNFELMKKFYKAYLNGFDNAADLRSELVLIHGYTETIQRIDELIMSSQ